LEGQGVSWQLEPAERSRSTSHADAGTVPINDPVRVDAWPDGKQPLVSG
jgi:hypothetical protein